MKIAVDAMGGDHAPKVIIEGAIAAAKQYQTKIILVGNQPLIENLLSKYSYDPGLISVCQASEVVDMSESAAASFRKKKNSSIVVGLNLIKDAQAGAFFSAGNTGAVVCAATLTLGMLPGIERPGIAVIVPAKNGVSLLIDVGANINPKPIQLLQYGIMADVYASNILGIENPTVGLLNVGEEEAKGTEFVKDTYELFEKSSLNFLGNVEGKDLFSGACSIIICDGFVGNVALKVSESAAETMQGFLKKELLNNPLGKFGLWLLRGSLKRFKKDLDYSEYGGAPLFGVNGVVIIGHGRSNANAIKNAIRVAEEEIDRKFNEKILEAIAPGGAGAGVEGVI